MNILERLDASLKFPDNERMLLDSARASFHGTTCAR